MNLRALSSGQTPLLGEENAMLLEGGAGTGATLNGEAAAAAAMGATPMVDRIGVVDEAATAGGRTARTNATPLTLSTARRDELGLNAPAAGDAPKRPPSELRSVVTTDHTAMDDAASVGGASTGASSFGASTFASSNRHMSLREIAREERKRAKRARRELEEALANLPAPQFEYELGVPEEEDATMEEAEDEDEGRKAGMSLTVRDRADEDEEELERLRKEAERIYEEQSSVMKRGELPRPKGGAVSKRLEGLIVGVAERDEDGSLSLDVATKLIHEEMATLINHDARANPILPNKTDPVMAAVASSDKKKDKKDKKRKHRQAAMNDGIPEVSLDYFPEDELQKAREMLEGEFEGIVREKRELLQSTKGVYYEEDADVLAAAVAETVTASCNGASGVSFSMDETAVGWNSAEPDDGDATIATLRAEYTALQNATKSLNKACVKLEQKLHVRTGGYLSRSASLVDATLHSFAELQHSRIEQSVYSRLRAHETKGATLRTEKLVEEVGGLEREEMNKQRKYGELMHEKNRLLLKIKGQGKKQAP